MLCPYGRRGSSPLGGTIQNKCERSVMKNSKKSNYDVDELTEHFLDLVDPKSEKTLIAYFRNNPTEESSEKGYLNLKTEIQHVEKENIRQTITSLMEDPTVYDFLLSP